VNSRLSYKMGWMVKFTSLLLYSGGKCSPYPRWEASIVKIDVIGSSDKLESINEIIRCPIPEKKNILNIHSHDSLKHQQNALHKSFLSQSTQFCLPTDGCRLPLHVQTRAHNRTLTVKVMKAMLLVAFQ
jgi:hypothetical protein